MPSVARAYQLKDLSELKKTYYMTRRLLASVSAVFVTLLTILGIPILGLFGADFVSKDAYLVILLFGAASFFLLGLAQPGHFYK